MFKRSLTDNYVSVWNALKIAEISDDFLVVYTMRRELKFLFAYVEPDDI